MDDMVRSNLVRRRGGLRGGGTRKIRCEKSDGASARYVPLAAARACVSAAVASARGLQPRICASERPRAAEAHDCTEGARRVAYAALQQPRDAVGQAGRARRGDGAPRAGWQK